MLNCIEMFERLAYFGIRAVVPLYIMQATEPGGLHLSATDKGIIYAVWAFFQSFLPIVTGGYADRYGYKRVLFFAISANVIGYLMMANLHSYAGFFAGVLVLATGTAFFKPALQGSIAQNLTKANSSVGWGIFYWVVNVGAVAAPIVSTWILGKPHSLRGWQNLFYTCAAFTILNLLLLLTFKDVPSGASKTESAWQVLKRTFVNIWDARLIAWLLIMSCFWLMMYQLWDLHPNFITDWVDSSGVARHMPEAWREPGDRGLLQVPQQILLNLNAALIVLLVVPMSWFARRMRTLSAMLVGMSVATCGVLVAGWTDNAWFLLLGIVFFSLGEMWTGPKKNEYLGLIAPPGKKGLYLGYVNIPVGIGLAVGSLLAGWLYNHWGEKATLALKELGRNPALLARAAQSADWSDALHRIPELIDIQRDRAFGLACADLAAHGLAADAASAAQTLRRLFQHDRGQAINLAYCHLALQPDYLPTVRVELARELRQLADRVATAALAAGVAGGNEDTTAPATASGPVEPADSTRALRDLAAQIEAGRQVPEVAVLARYAHRLPSWTKVKPPEVLEVVRQQINAARPADHPLEESQLITWLWEQFGGDPGVLDNLALEYLAQSTAVVYDAVAKLRFNDPVRDIPDILGIDRTKSFAALSMAMGADDPTLDCELSRIGVASGEFTDRAYAYLAGPQCEHIRFVAVAKKDWTRDVSFLRELVESDAAAKSLVESLVDRRSVGAGIRDWIAGTFGSNADNQDLYQRLARRPDVIQRALAAKDWTRSPDQAARLLELNPFEARALAGAQVNNAPLAVTKLLWQQYRPQYKVWIPIAAVGVAATIALAIFGQMARRWKDMDA